MNPDEVVSDIFRQFCKENDLRIVAENIDRHGSLEWLAVHTDSMERFISVDFTEIQVEGTTNTHVVMESWAQVVTGDRARRMRAFEDTLDRFAADTIEPYLHKALEAAWYTALAVTEESIEAAPSLLRVPNRPAV
jgi:hypothetical protein